MPQNRLPSGGATRSHSRAVDTPAGAAVAYSGTLVATA
jgi:hypothetical protein